MHRGNLIVTQATIRRQRVERATSLLDGLRAADRYLHMNHAHVGRVDVSATVALRCMDFLDDAMTVGEVRQMLFDLAVRVDDITPSTDAECVRINELAARVAGIQTGAV